MPKIAKFRSIDFFYAFVLRFPPPHQGEGFCWRSHVVSQERAGESLQRLRCSLLGCSLRALWCPHVILAEGHAETHFAGSGPRCCGHSQPWSRSAMGCSACHVTSGDPRSLSSTTSSKLGEPQPRFPQQDNGNTCYKPGLHTS